MSSLHGQEVEGDVGGIGALQLSEPSWMVSNTPAMMYHQPYRHGKRARNLDHLDYRFKLHAVSWWHNVKR